MAYHHGIIVRGHPVTNSYNYRLSPDVTRLKQYSSAIFLLINSTHNITSHSERLYC